MAIQAVNLRSQLDGLVDIPELNGFEKSVGKAAWLGALGRQAGVAFAVVSRLFAVFASRGSGQSIDGCAIKRPVSG